MEVESNQTLEIENESVLSLFSIGELDKIFEFYPSDGDTGYMKSFDPTDFNAIQETIEKYGFVVVKNVLTKEQCDITIDEFFWDINRRAEYLQKEPVDRNVPRTWESCNFPAGNKGNINNVTNII
jgi:hypothetical protein